MSTQHPALREIAGYKVLRELGRGGAGAVYLAVQEALDRHVAIKILHRDMAEEDVYLQRFFREAKAAAIFSHPNVVAVHDAGEDKASGDYYIAFEYVDGGSLEELLKDGGKLSETRALEITREVAQALFFAESKNMIHRDVKPANILITQGGVAKLADLGLAKKTDPEAPKVTVEGLIVGTPYYMAPEQALGRVDIDNRVDIYALGLVLYCMLTGRTPYLETREENSTVLHVLSRRLTEELPNVKALEADVSDGTARLIEDMTARKRERRYRSAADVIRDVNRILDGTQPLGPDGVEPRLSDLPTTSVDAATLHAAMATANPGLADTLAAARGEGSGASSDSGAASPASDSSTDLLDPTESGVRRAARKLASSSSAELETIRQRPLYGALLVIVLAMGIGLGALGRSTRRGQAATSPSASAPELELPPMSGSPASPGPEQSPGASPSPHGTARPSPAPTASVQATPAPPTPAPRPSPSPTASASPEDGSEDHTAPGSPPPPVPAADELNPELVRRVSAALFQDVPQGARTLDALTAGSDWEASRAGKYFVAVLGAARGLLDHRDTPWEQRERSLDALDAALNTYRLDRRPLAGETGRAVASELKAWGGFALGIRTLRQAIADPRLRAKALENMREVPAQLGVADSADLLLGLIDRVDRHQRWLRLDSVRADLGPHLREVQAKLATNAVGYALREEVQAVCAVLGQLVDDEQSCLIAALSHPSVDELPPTAFLAARTQTVPHRASLRDMSGWGVRVDLKAPPGPGDTLKLKVDGYEVELTQHLAKIGSQSWTINWQGSRRVFAALRTHQLLIRVEGATPQDLTILLPFERGGPAPKFTVRTLGQLELTGVVLAQIPQAPQAGR